LKLIHFGKERMRKIFRIYLIVVLCLPVWIEAQTKQIPYKVLLQTPVKVLTFDQLKITMLRRLNEMRAEENRLHPKRMVKLNPFKYSMKLEELGFYYIAHKNPYKIFDKTQPNGLDVWVHWDNDSNGVIDRFRRLNVKYIKVIKYDSPKRTSGEIISIGENVVSTNGSINELCNALKKSPGHWRWIKSPVITHVGFGYKNDFPLIVQEFAKLE